MRRYPKLNFLCLIDAYVAGVFDSRRFAKNPILVCNKSTFISLLDWHSTAVMRARFLLLLLLLLLCAMKDTHRDPTTDDRNIDGAYETSDEVKTRNRERQRERLGETERRNERFWMWKKDTEDGNSRQWSDDSFCRPPEILIRQDPPQIFLKQSFERKRKRRA